MANTFQYFYSCNEECKKADNFDGLAEYMNCDGDLTYDYDSRKLKDREVLNAPSPIVVDSPPSLTAREAVPTFTGGGWNGFCGFPGTMCLGKEVVDSEKDSNEAEEAPTQVDVDALPSLAAREAAPIRTGGGWNGFCGFPGTMCLGKETVDSEEDSEPELPSTITAAPQHSATADPAELMRTGGGWTGFCGFPGGFCSGGVVAVEHAHEATAVFTTSVPQSLAAGEEQVYNDGYCGEQAIRCVGKIVVEGGEKHLEVRTSHSIRMSSSAP